MDGRTGPPASLLGRYDVMSWAAGDADITATRIIAGYAYHFLPGNFAMIDFDRLSYSDDALEPEWEVKATVQVHFP